MRNYAILNFEVIARSLLVETERYQLFEASDAAIPHSKKIEFRAQSHERN